MSDTIPKPGDIVAFAPGEDVPEWLMGGPDRMRCTLKFTAFAHVQREQDGRYIIRHKPGAQVIHVEPLDGDDVMLDGGNGSGVTFIAECDPQDWSWKIQ